VLLIPSLSGTTGAADPAKLARGVEAERQDYLTTTRNARRTGQINSLPGVPRDFVVYSTLSSAARRPPRRTLFA
jgi:hypothetical protein